MADTAQEIPIFHKTETDLFSVPPIQSSIDEGKWITHTPINSLDRCTYLEFNVSADGSEYIDLANTFLKLGVRVVDTRPGQNDLHANCDVAPTNNFLHSLFSNVALSLNNTPVTVNNTNYPYRAYMENLLSYGSEAKKSYLQSEGFFKDTSNHMDDVIANADNVYTNKGFKQRRELVARSKQLDLKGKLHLDMFQQNRLLLNGVGVTLKLYRSSDAFCLMGRAPDPAAAQDWKKATFGVEILKAELYVRKVTLTAPLALYHVNSLSTQTAKYPIKRVMPKAYNINAGVGNHTERAIFKGQIPSRITVGIVSNEAYNGVIQRNPFNFQHFNCTAISLLVDGRGVPVTPMQMDYTRGQYIDAYLSLFTETGQYGSDEGNGISRDDYGKGFTLYCFNLNPDHDAEGGHLSITNNGEVDIIMNFANVLNENLTVIAMAEFDNTIEIDRFRQVTTDYN